MKKEEGKIRKSSGIQKEKIRTERKEKSEETEGNRRQHGQRNE